jgi:hypothetical protein
MTFVIPETGKTHYFIYFGETFSDYATFYFFAMS